MRINLYHHEMPWMAQRAEHVRTVADTGVEFHGLRLYTEQPLEHQPGDDDSAAVTLWVPWTRRGGHDTRDLRRIADHITVFCDAVDSVGEPTNQSASTARRGVLEQETPDEQ